MITIWGQYDNNMKLVPLHDVPHKVMFMVIMSLCIVFGVGAVGVTHHHSIKNTSPIKNCGRVFWGGAVSMTHHHFIKKMSPIKNCGRVFRGGAVNMTPTFLYLNVPHQKL